MKYVLSLTLGFLSFCSISAQDILAGSLSFEVISGLTYKFNIDIYTYGDGGTKVDSLLFMDGAGSFYVVTSDTAKVSDNIIKWHYEATATYPSGGAYVQTVSKGDRVPYIKNIQNSGIQEMVLNSELVLGLGVNDSPLLTNSLVTTGSIGGQVNYNPGAMDPDGDLLIYSLEPSSGVYTKPAGATIDTLTGDITVPVSNTPLLVRFRIYEVRGGLYIGYTQHEVFIADVSGIGISEIKRDPTVKLYPNPASDKFNLDIPRDLLFSQLLISDLTGKELIERSVSSQTTQIDISELPSGIYLVQVGSEIQKIIVE